MWVETSCSCFHVHIPAMPTTSLHVLDIQWYYTHMIRRIYITIRTYVTYSKYIIVWYITCFSDSDWSSPGRIMGPQSINDPWEAFASLVGQLFAREAPHALVRAPQMTLTLRTWGSWGYWSRANKNNTFLKRYGNSSRLSFNRHVLNMYLDRLLHHVCTHLTALLVTVPSLLGMTVSSPRGHRVRCWWWWW